MRDLAMFRPSAKEFWSILPQLADTHRPIRHATIAIAVLQEPVIRPQLRSDFELRTIAYSHFNQAIRGFLESVPSFGTLPRLTCCLLFNELSKALERVPAGGEHVKGARAILKTHETAVAHGEAEFHPLIASTLAPMILRCTLDALTYLDGFDVEGDVLRQSQDMLLRLPSTLSSIGEAVELLDIIVKYALAFHAARSISKDRLVIAIANFDQLLDYSTMALAGHIPALRVHLQAAMYLVNSNQDDNSHLLEDIVRIFAGIPIKFWQPTLGLIPPLFLAATKCRDEAVRNRALELLHGLNVREHGLSSCMATRLAVSTRNNARYAHLTTGMMGYDDFPLEGLQINHSPNQRRRGEDERQQQRLIQSYGYCGAFYLSLRTNCDCKNP